MDKSLTEKKEISGEKFSKLTVVEYELVFYVHMHIHATLNYAKSAPTLGLLKTNKKNGIAVNKLCAHVQSRYRKQRSKLLRLIL